MFSLQKSQEMLEKSQKKAEELGISVSIVIVDSYGSIISAARMDGAIPISPRFAYAKAFTSASIGMPTEAMAEYAEEGKPYHGVNSIFGGEITTIAGGFPIMDGDTLVGGIGVGGSMDVSQDAEIAKAGL